jgi:hypothetical protein
MNVQSTKVTVLLLENEEGGEGGERGGEREREREGEMLSDLYSLQ